MKHWKVRTELSLIVTVDVDAETEDDAYQQAEDIVWQEGTSIANLRDNPLWVNNWGVSAIEAEEDDA